MDNNYSIGNRTCSNRYLVIINVIITLLGVGLYAINQMYLKDHLEVKFFHCYFNDILAGLLIIAYINLLFILVEKSQYCLKRLWSILAVNVVIGFFWEFITPFYRHNSITDNYDLFAYIFGGSLYYIVIKVSNCYI